jgi:hypothetical protein
VRRRRQVGRQQTKFVARRTSVCRSDPQRDGQVPGDRGWSMVSRNTTLISYCFQWAMRSGSSFAAALPICGGDTRGSYRLPRPH